MSDRKKDLVQAYFDKKMSRRELFDRMAKLGVGAAATGVLMNSWTSKALAAGGSVDFKKHKGKTIRLLMNKHPYMDAIIKNLDSFKTMTGMNVTYDIFPEDVYFDKVTTALAGKGTQYDAFMTGAYQTWKYGPAGWIVDLNEFIKDPKLTSDAYNWEDVLPRASARRTSWDGQGRLGAGRPRLPSSGRFRGASSSTTSPTTSGSSTSSASQPPKNLPDLVEKAAKITRPPAGPTASASAAAAAGRRSTRASSRATPTTALKDFEVKDGKLKAAMNCQGVEGVPQDCGSR